jgi:hypothetical protein
MSGSKQTLRTLVVDKLVSILIVNDTSTPFTKFANKSQQQENMENAILRSVNERFRRFQRGMFDKRLSGKSVVKRGEAFFVVEKEFSNRSTKICCFFTLLIPLQGH